MQTPFFEWDDDKAALNERRHGLTFIEAAQAFDDNFGLEWLDQDNSIGEERWCRLGRTTDSRLLYVAFTFREQRIRIISARFPEPFEIGWYDDDNQT